MNYIEFNKRCCDYYLKNNEKNAIGSFLIPPSEIVDWLGLEYDNPKIHFNELFKDWFYFTKEDPFNKIPLSFGIIALQCYGAFLRQNTLNTTDRQLNISIVRLIGFNNLQQLQIQFGDGYPNNQDLIWINARDFLTKYDISISIPQPTSGPGRNVKYPKSQVFFTLQMFKDLHPILTEAEEKYINKFEDFRSLIIKKLRDDNQIIKGINQILRNTVNANKERQVFISQLYNFWRSSDWKNIYLRVLQQKNYKKRISDFNLDVNFQIYFDFENNIFEYFSIEQNIYQDLHETNINRVIEIGPVLFTNNPNTPFDFHQVINFEFNTTYLIYCSTNSDFHKKLEQFEGILWYNSGNITMAFIHGGFNDPKVASLFNDYSNSVIFNAIKLVAPYIDFRRKVILPGYDIKISLNSEYISKNEIKLYAKNRGVIGNEVKINESENVDKNYFIIKNLKQGRYRICSSKFNDIDFEIANLSNSESIVFSKKSINPQDLNIQNDLSGIHSLFYPSNIINNNLSYKNIYESLILKKRRHSKNILLKAINLSNYGRN